MLLAHFHRGVKVEDKGDRDLVSVADREAEALLLDRLAAAFGDDAVVAEERDGHGTRAPAGRRRWYVDPLDGTVNFLKGLPLWGISLGLCDPDDRPLAGVIVFPLSGTTYTAVRDAGARRDGVPLQPTRADRLDRALAAFAHPGAAGPWGGRDRVAAGRAALNGVMLGSRVQGCSVADLCAVADGTVDVLWTDGMAPWDVAAGLLIAREAGVQVTDPDGRAVDTPCGSFLATAPALHDTVRTLISR